MAKLALYDWENEILITDSKCFYDIDNIVKSSEHNDFNGVETVINIVRY